MWNIMSICSRGDPAASQHRRGMFKRELGVSRLLDLDHQRHSSFGAAERKGLPRVLERDGIDVLEIAIRTALDHAATKLGVLIGIVEIDDGECNPRVALCVLRFERAFPSTDQDAVTFAARPNGCAL